MLSREGFSQLSRGSRCNLREIVTVSRSLDVLKCLAARSHSGGTNLDYQMAQYIYKRKSDGIYIINLKRTWEKLLLAALAIAALETLPMSVSVSRNTGQ